MAPTSYAWGFPEKKQGQIESHYLNKIKIGSVYCAVLMLPTSQFILKNQFQFQRCFVTTILEETALVAERLK